MHKAWRAILKKSFLFSKMSSSLERLPPDPAIKLILFRHFLGLAFRPTDLIALSCPRDSNPGSEDLRRSLLWVGLFLFWVFGQFFVSVLCLSRDWARCRAALGAKKLQSNWAKTAWDYSESVQSNLLHEHQPTSLGSYEIPNHLPASRERAGGL